MIVKSYCNISFKFIFKKYKHFENNFDNEYNIVEIYLKKHNKEYLYLIRINIDGGDQFEGYLYCHFLRRKIKNKKIDFDNIIFKGKGKDTYYYNLNNKRQKIKKISKLKNMKCLILGELFFKNNDNKTDNNSIMFKDLCCTNELKNEIDKIINLGVNKEISDNYKYKMNYIMCC